MNAYVACDGFIQPHCYYGATGGRPLLLVRSTACEVNNLNDSFMAEALA
jgi:hypothetical protein